MDIKHFFVLMLENRSYDNIFGFSEFREGDPETGNTVTAENLIGGTYQVPTLGGAPAVVAKKAKYRLRRVGDKKGPAHEFTDTLLDLCGPQAFSSDTIADDVKSDTYHCKDGVYPPLLRDPSKSGYALDYGHHGGRKAGDVTNCFSPEQLPVLNQLAHEFVVCDHWFSSMPGPTWPNRFFGLCGSSGCLDHSQTFMESAASSAHVDGFKFENGSIFDRLGNDWLVVHGGFSQAIAISGVEHKGDKFIEPEDFWNRLRSGALTEKFIWIEPYFDVFFDYELGHSMHPHGDVRSGEALVKKVYEEIRNSKYWKDSLLLIVFDENGGFYDHVVPPAPNEDLVPGDHPMDKSYNKHGFRFDVLGPRVPAIVVSPWVRKGGVDKTQYDHTAIIKTASDLFDFEPRLGKRVDRSASIKGLMDVPSPRLTPEEAPKQLPDPNGHPAVWWRVIWGYISSWFRSRTVPTTTEAPFAAAAIRMHAVKTGTRIDDLRGKSEKDLNAYLESQVGVYKMRGRKKKL